ncbi:MAG TPA: hypothetical protein VJN96_06140 [Vicinamibacterales bacterium]|nr:hypothetical protein [Vicinamibacterales bacterium]
MKTSVARKFVRLYPRAWRERYEEEFVALLDARGDLTWLDTVDILGAAGREWARAIGHWSAREPADELQAPRRQTIFDLVVIGLTASALELIARAIAGVLHGWTFGGGLGSLMFVQAAVALRCAFTYRRATKRLLHVGERELVVWLTVILAAAVLAHLDPSRSPLMVDPSWLRLFLGPAFNLYVSVIFLMTSTPAAVYRTERRRALLERHRRASVPPNPLGLR